MARAAWSTAAAVRCAARAGPLRGWSGGSCGCAGDTESARSRSPAGWVWRPQPCTRCWSAAHHRLSRIDRVTGEPIRRYEYDHPGALIHVDVTKFGNIPDGGGHRYVGRQQGDRNKRATPGLPKGNDYKPRTGTAYLHTVIDDHSRVAYAEIHTDEKSDTACRVLRNAVAWFADHGVAVERVLSDNGAAYRSLAWRETCIDLAVTPKPTRPYRPQTNGKIERFHRTLADGWAYARYYDSDHARRAALPPGCTSTITTEPTAQPEPSHRSAA